MLSTEAYRKIIDNLRDCVYIVDTDRRIIYWNQAAERISGFSKEEVIGRGCAENILCHLDDSGATICQGECPLAVTIKEGTPRDAEVFLHHKNGHRCRSRYG